MWYCSYPNVMVNITRPNPITKMYCTCCVENKLPDIIIGKGLIK